MSDAAEADEQKEEIKDTKDREKSAAGDEVKAGDQAEESRLETTEPALQPATGEDRVEESVESPAEEKPQKQRRPSTRKGRKNQPTLPYVTARFAGCGRCSFFWAGYEVIHGKPELEAAVADSKSGWLELSWHRKMKDLINRSYGVRLDIEYFHYEACCKECRRHFVFKAGEGEEEPAAFRIEITPRVSR